MVMPAPIEPDLEVNDPNQPTEVAPGNEEQPVEAPANGGGDITPETPEDPKKSRDEVKHERYIDKLSQELRLGNEASSRYDDNLFGNSQPYKPLEIKDGEEYTPAQLEDDRTRIADSKFAEGLSRGMSVGTTRATLENFETKLDIDKDRVALKWDALDPEKTETYNPKLEQHLVQRYIEFSGMEKDDKGRITIARPNVRFRDFVDAEMQNMEDYAASRATQSGNNIRSQAGRTSVRPNGQTPPPKEGHGFDPNDPAGSVSRMSSEQYHKLGGREASDAYLAARGLAPKA